MLSQDHIKQCFLWLKEKRRYKNGTSRSCRRCCLVTVEGGCQEEAQKEKGKEEGGVNEIAQEVVEGSKEKVSVHDGIKEAVQRKGGKVSCEAGIGHKIENEKEEESW